MTEQQREMIEYTTQELIRYMMKDRQVPMEQAMKEVYSSKTFANLTDIETGMYLDGGAYVYEMLKKEVQNV